MINIDRAFEEELLRVQRTARAVNRRRFDEDFKNRVVREFIDEYRFIW
jgi:hypothetical protein